MEPTIYVLNRNMKNIRIYLSENFHLLLVKFSIYWNRHVFKMDIFLFHNSSILTMKTYIVGSH